MIELIHKLVSSNLFLYLYMKDDKEDDKNKGYEDASKQKT